MAWRLARSLDVLRGEVRALHPGSRVDTIGDQAHAAGASDHNPNTAEVVCAADFFPNAGLNLGRFAEHVRDSGHVAVKYVIFNRRIWSTARAGEGWRTYSGANPHTGHVHVSVGVGPDGRSTGPYDNPAPWGLLEEKEEDEMAWDEQLPIPAWMMQARDENGQPWGEAPGWEDKRISAQGAVVSGYGHSRQVNQRTTAMAVQLAAIHAAVAGEDQVAAVQAAIRAEFAALGPALAAELDGVSVEQITEALTRLRFGVVDGDPPA